MHRIVGLTQSQERIYRHILTTGPTGVEKLTELFGDHAAADMHELTVRGLIHGNPPVARRPSVALNGILAFHESRMQQMHRYLTELDQLYTSGHSMPDGEPVQVLTHRSAVQQWYEQIHATARQEVMQLITHPFLPLTNTSSPALNTDQEPEHPAKCRVICEWKVFENHKARNGLQHSTSRGCEIRLADRLPHKLLIGDRNLALTPRYPRGHPEIRQMLLIHPGTLLDFLVEVFEAEWERALPIQPDHGHFTDDDLDTEEMLIVEMLSRGAHVDRIATALGVHSRTVNRRLDELKRRAGVTTLFQLGAYAASHWIRGSFNGA